MNVSGVGATPPPPLLPPVAPPQPSTAAPASDGRPGSGPNGRPPERRQEQPAQEAPPLRVLTVTEMRVMLGQLPASAAFKLEQQRADPSAP